MWISKNKLSGIKNKSYREGYTSALDMIDEISKFNAKTLIISDSYGHIYVKDDIMSIYSNMIIEKYLLVTKQNGTRQVIFTDDIIHVEEIYKNKE